MAADPEGRFLLIHSHSSGNLYRLEAGAVDPVLLFASPDPAHPVLPAKTLDLYDHDVDGRVAVMVDQENSLIAENSLVFVLKDADNDGIFETNLVKNQTEYADYVTEVKNLVVIP